MVGTRLFSQEGCCLEGKATEATNAMFLTRYRRLVTEENCHPVTI